MKAIIKVVWTEQCGNLLRIEIPGEGCTSLPRVEPGQSFVCRPYASSWGAQRLKLEVSQP